MTSLSVSHKLRVPNTFFKAANHTDGCVIPMNQTITTRYLSMATPSCIVPLNWWYKHKPVYTAAA